MFKRVIVLAILSIGVALFANAQEAQEERLSRAEEMQRMHKEAIENLPDITQEQINELQAMEKRNKSEMDPMREKMREVRKQMRALRDAESEDMEQMKNMIRESNALRTEMELKRLDQRQAVKEILTKEQFAALEENRQKMHGEMKEYHKKRHALRKEMRQMHGKKYHHQKYGDMEQEHEAD